MALPLTLEGNCINASAAVKASAGVVYAIILTAGADTATATFYDSLVASGERELKLSAVTNTSVTFTPSIALAFNKGIYVVTTGTTPSVTIVYT